MRSVLALGLLITLCASADAATVHRSKPSTVHLRTRQHVIVRHSQDVAAPRGGTSFPAIRPYLRRRIEILTRPTSEAVNLR